MSLMAERHANGRLTMRRRAPDLVERMLGLVFAGGLLVSLLLVIASTLGLVWLITVIVADLARRLGL